MKSNNSKKYTRADYLKLIRTRKQKTSNINLNLVDESNLKAIIKILQSLLNKKITLNKFEKLSSPRENIFSILTFYLLLLLY